jgi:hypothetical protein
MKKTLLIAVALPLSCGEAHNASTDSNIGGAQSVAGSAGHAGSDLRASGGTVGGSTSGGSATGGAGRGGAPGCPALLPAAATFDNNAATSWIQIQGEPAGSEIGVFDPSVRKASNGTLVMSYSSVNLARDRIHTRIAVSNDGTTYTYAAMANQAVVNVDIAATNDPDCPSGTCSGVNLAHETSALVEDSTDIDPQSRWKVFTHRYVILDNPLDPNSPVLKYAYGYIARVTAPSPEGPWSEETPVIGWPSNSPISSTATTTVSALEGMQDCITLTEPSAIVDPTTGVLEVAVGCVFLQEGVGAIRIELLHSTDHGKTFTHARRLLSASDSTCLGETEPQMNAAHLFDRGGQRYLIATPAGPVVLPGGIASSAYRGCFVFRRTNDGIERDSAGAPVVYGRIDPKDDVFSGACSDIPTGGYAMSVLSDNAPNLFRMYGPIAKNLP